MRLIKALVAATLVAVALTARPSAQTPGTGPVVTGQILVKFRPGASAAAKAAAHREAAGRMVNEIARTGVQLVAVQAGDETGAVNRYRRNPNVLYAEHNFIRSVPTPANHTAGTEVVPGDHYFKEQWALNNTGQQFYCFPWIDGQELCFYVGTNDADIDAPEAWAISTGTPVTVAVIDTGIDYTHPDLAANYDGGINFVTPGATPFDDHGHGTHVSGTIAAALNNLTGNPAEEEGVVGVAPNARILAYKVCTPDGHCDDFLIQQAIAAAVAAGAKVINLSLGGPDYSISMNEAVQDAWNAGLVIVAGAGNNGDTSLFYPAAYDNVISVGAFDEDDRRASFSSYGSWVDISAPGNVILSSYPMAACVAANVPGDTGCYTWLSGTSMATPHVSGAAALVWSRADVTTNQQVVDILLNSADPQGVDAVRLDSWTIHGGLNIHNALSFGVTNLSPIASAGPDQTVRDADGDGVELVALNGSASSDPDGTIVNYEWREGSNVLALVASPSLFLSVGTHTLTLQVTDDHGATGTDSVVVNVNPNQPPTANAGPDQTVRDTGGNGAEVVILNGSASSDADGSIVNYEWREGTTVIAAGASPSVSLAVGTHTLTLRVTDNDGATGTDSVVVTVNPNSPPTANAGPDQTVRDTGGNGAEVVILNGTASSDADGSIVAFEWREGTTVIAAGASPSVSLAVGTHTLTLRVTDNDGATGTDSVVVTVNPNSPPTANAGPDQTVRDTGGNGAEVVVLNGTASSDADGSIVNYEWREGTTVIAAGASPSVSLAVGTHTLTLRVTDNDGATGTDGVVVIVNPNSPPTANAGPDQTVRDTGGNGAEVVALNGSASSDADGSIVNYEWREGTTVVAVGASPSVSLPVGTHTLTLRVTDNDGATGTDSVVVTVNPNSPPTANAGPDQTVSDTGGDGAEVVVLNGSASSDPDGSIVNYEWREGTTVIAIGTSPSISLAVGTHTLTLRVTDNDGATGTDSMVVTVSPAAGPTTVHIGDLDGSSTGNKSTWTALLTVTVHNTNHVAVAGAVVTGTWSDGAAGSGTCTTSGGGTCSVVSSSLRKKDSVATFTVTGVAASGLAYSAAQNHDPDGDSTGTVISIAKP